MTGARFSGLTWDHPRGFRALEAAAERDCVIAWTRQPLEGFESHPIADLAQRYDLLVLDHPHIGEAVAERCLQPMERHFAAAEIAAWATRTIGGALPSYRWEGRHYALPLDVAAQVMARDPDALPEPPDTWEEVLRLSERHPVALSLAGPHALLSFFSLCLSLGGEPGGLDLIEDGIGREAFEMMQRLTAKAPQESVGLNPIGLLEAMGRRTGIALAPLVFGYVNYANGSPERRAVAFSEAPRIGVAGRRGSVLGGTGIAITQRARPTTAVLDHLRWLMSEDAQVTFIPAHDGQPSALAAWRSDAVNKASAGFYRATAATIANAWIRPRFAGYIAFQTAASALLRKALAGSSPSAATLEAIRAQWRAAQFHLSENGPAS
jgi:multiple sugar transport system substrate-binding protein